MKLNNLQTLKEFWDHLVLEIQDDQMQKLVYRVLYFTLLEKTPDEIDKMLRAPEGLAAMILDSNHEKVKTLKNVMLSMFLKNLEISNGCISDTENVLLVNAELFQFHSKNHL